MDTILLTGKTGLFSEEALGYMAETYHVLVTGRKKTDDPGNLPGNVRSFAVRPSDSDFQKVFELGKIRAVWHVCTCADGGRPLDQGEQIDRILHLCARNQIPRVIVLTESTDPTRFRSLIESRCRPEAGLPPVEMAVVCLPLLIGTGSPQGRMKRMMEAVHSKKRVILEGSEHTRISVLPMMELTALLLRMTGETWFRSGIFAAEGSAAVLENIREVLQVIRPDAQIEYAEETDAPLRGAREAGPRGTVRFRMPYLNVRGCDGRLGEMYRLPVSSDWRREVSACCSALLREDRRAFPFKDRVSRIMKKSGPMIGAVLDIAVMFLLAEYLGRITSESVYFKIVDVRLLFVILMGMMHGLAAGTAAALLECVMLVIRYSQIGISGLLLFYNVENWIPFAYYLTAGVISGYSHQKRTQEMRSVMAENQLIRSKYLFLNEAYSASVSDRKELRAQILSEEESYAKLYGAVRSMSQRTPEAVCVEAVRVLRELLDNDTVSIYQMNPAGTQARLLSCCRENAVRQVLDARECRDMIEVIQTGETWKNVSLSENAPMYAARVAYRRALRHDLPETGEITLVVTVEKAEQDQLSLWYLNHFSILCGLFQDALERASLRERNLS